MSQKTQYGHSRALRAVGSLWFAAVLLVLAPAAMAYATVFESTHGTEQALAVFYHSWWFETLLTLLAVNVAAALALRFPFSKRQIGFVVTHASILLTFAGALVTKHFGVDGQIGVVEGETVGQISVGRDMLIVLNSRDQSRREVDLSDVIGGRFRPIDLDEPRTLVLGDLRVETVRYLPDSDWVRRISDDDPLPRPAVEVALSGVDEGPTLVFAGRPAQVGGVSVAYRVVPDAQELDRLLNRAPTSQPSSKGVVRIEYERETYEFSVEEVMHAPAPLGDTGNTVRVLRHLLHATVAAGGKVVESPSRPLNPFIEVELTGPSGSETHRAFSRFPGFESMHGTSQTPGLKLTYVVDSADDYATPIEVLSGPGDELHVRFTGHGGQVVTHALEVGAAIESVWPGRHLTVLHRYENARVEWILEPVEPVRQARTPAILARLTTPNETAEQWLQRHRAVPVRIGGESYELMFGDQAASLGFTLTLDRFRVGFYPGGEQPRSFESQVTITDPETGRTQTRVISMNRPASFGGYTFYQSSYRKERGQTVSFLSVSRDPGLPIVFAGYIGLMLGMIIVLGTRLAEHSRRSGRSPAIPETLMQA